MKNKITMKKNQVTKNRGLLYLLFPFFCVLCLGISIKAQEKKDIKAIDVSDDPTLKVDDLKLEITKVDSKKTIDTIESKVVDTSKKAINNTNNVSNYDNEKGMNLEQKDTKKNENAQIEKIQNLENVDKKSNDIEIIIDSKKTDSKDKIEISANMILQDDLEIPIVKEKNSVDNKLKNDNIIQKDERYSLKYILGLFNSKLLNYWYKSYFDNVNINPAQLRLIPIHAIDFKKVTAFAQHQAIVNLVSQMLELQRLLSLTKELHGQKVLQRQIVAVDAAIDKMVYELYDLTPDEIENIEKNE